MATLSEDLRVLADQLDAPMAALPTDVAGLPEELKKINWKRLVCFVLPVFNLVGPIYGLPPLPVPAFCTTPEPTPTPSPVG